MSLFFFFLSHSHFPIIYSFVRVLLRSKLSSFKFYNQGALDQFAQVREVPALEVVPNPGDQK